MNMKQPEDLMKALDICSNRRRMEADTAHALTTANACVQCPYTDITECQTELQKDALCFLKAQMDVIERLSAKKKPEADSEPWTREKILDTAKQYICGPREEAYGSPEKGFRMTALLWETYLRSRCVPPDNEVALEPEDVAIMMVLLKVSRLAATPDHLDGWIDIAGYAALGGEISQRFTREKRRANHEDT